MFELKAGITLEANQNMNMDSYNKINNAASYNSISKGAKLRVYEVEDGAFGITVWYHYGSNDDPHYFIASKGTIKRRFNIIENN